MSAASTSKRAVRGHARASSVPDQSSSSSAANVHEDSPRGRRSASVSSTGAYEELSDSDFDNSEIDDFEDDEPQDDDDDDDNENTHSSSSSSSTPNSRKPLTEHDTNTVHTRSTLAKVVKNSKKRKTVSNDKGLEKLVWKETKTHLTTALPQCRRRDDDIDYSDNTPHQLFELLFTKRWQKRVVSMMNSYHLLSTRSNINTNVPELLAMIAIHIYMGIHNLPRIHMYWSCDQPHPFVTSLMSRDRFKTLTAAFCLHQTKNGLAEDDPVVHCSSFINHFNQTAPSLDRPSQFFSFDEAMCAYTGRSAYKQYLPMKPHPYGFKFYSKESRNFCRWIELFAGKTDDSSEDGKLCDLTMRAMADDLGKHNVLYCHLATTIEREEDVHLWVCQPQPPAVS